MHYVSTYIHEHDTYTTYIVFIDAFCTAPNTNAQINATQRYTLQLGVTHVHYFSFSQGVELHQNVTAGIILTDQSLVVQTVTRASAGDYTCLAANTEGKVTSNPVTLRVRCKCVFVCVYVCLLPPFNTIPARTCYVDCLRAECCNCRLLKRRAALCRTSMFVALCLHIQRTTCRACIVQMRSLTIV